MFVCGNDSGVGCPGPGGLKSGYNYNKSHLLNNYNVPGMNLFNFDTNLEHLHFIVKRSQSFHEWSILNASYL